MDPKLFPYLIFNGVCTEAMKFYQSVLGGELTLQTYGESGMPVAEEEKGLIINSELKNEGLSFMASDDNKKSPVTMGSNVHMSISGSDEALLTQYFNKLAEGGKIDTPLEKQFWGDTFGMLTDKFGVHWMINITSSQPQK